MNKQHWLQENWGLLLLSGFAIAMVPVIYGQLPTEVPLHWNASGEVDRVGERSEALVPLLFLAGSVVLVNGVFWLLPFLDPRKNVAKFKPTLRKLQWIITGFLVFLNGLIFSAMMGFDQWMFRLLPMAILIFTMLIGNYLGKLKPNYFMGIRLPWTLDNEDNWRQTHRYSARVWVISSLLMMFLHLLTPVNWGLYLLIPFFLVIILLPTWFSYRLYQQQNA